MGRAYIPMTPSDRDEMLAAIGLQSIDDLFRDVPASAEPADLSDFSQPMAEIDLARLMDGLSRSSTPAGNVAFFRGGGAYRRFTPAVVDEIVRRGEFLTSYTPYQPEASQGTLMAAFEFQSGIASLYAMEVANAGMYDGASALAEACLMACRITRRERIAASRAVNPRYLDVLRTYTRPQGIHIDLLTEDGTGLTSEHACLAIQSPDYFGRIVLKDRSRAELAHHNGALLVVSADPMSLAVLRPPGELGADIAVGEGQSLGLPLSFGGPYVGLFTTKLNYVRQMPGRIVGQTTDRDGRRAFVLTLQTREQHIRRERASSNICTSEQLLALAVTVYMGLLGPEGLRETARLCYDRAHYAAEKLSSIPGFSLAYPDEPFFQEFLLRCPLPIAEINSRLRQAGIVGGIDASTSEEPLMLLCCTETNVVGEIDRLADMLSAWQGWAASP
jgi:glycine dehydrogenase subunit 1